MVLAERPSVSITPTRVAEEPEDILSNYLPGILRQDHFLSNFTRIFDAMLRPLLTHLDAVDYYFDPRMTPAELLPWLGSWLGEALPESWPTASRRALIAESATIHRARGTKAGLKRALELLTGREVLVTDGSEGFRLDEDGRLGVNSSLQIPEPHRIFIVIRGGGEVDLKPVNELIHRLKPAHADFSVRVTDE
jgi:phage tail-like protein